MTNVQVGQTTKEWAVEKAHWDLGLEKKRLKL